ncbi:MAG: glutathione peroxidase [Acidimicrobiales bacterium]|jgi:glutathione peroxidase
MAIYDAPIRSLQGEPLDLHRFEDKAMLIVNVASHCGLTPQYSGLEALQRNYAGRGFTVLGVPCNQFGGQEPGSAEEIEAFCSTTFGVSFPMTEKLEVNGSSRHQLYADLTQVADGQGEAGDIQWNFEKFLVAPGGRSVVRFRPTTEPETPEVVTAIESVLPG